ncbi:MAG: DUF3293 domain-containing protein [Rhodanobacteraceae bacterium]
MESVEQIRELIALYRASHYDVALANGQSATIRIGADAPPDIARWIGAHSKAIYMTACNPYSRTLSADENAVRMERLRQQVRDHGGDYLEGVGYMPGESWREPSLLVSGLEMPVVDALVAEHEQNAVVVVPARGHSFLRIHRVDWQNALGSLPGVEWAT